VARTAKQYREDAWRIWKQYGVDVFGVFDAAAPRRASDYREYDVRRFDAMQQASRPGGNAAGARTQILQDHDAAFSAGRNGDRFQFRRDFPDAARGERSMLRQEYRAGTAVRRVERAPRALQGSLTVRRDRTGAPVLRLEGVGKGWRAAPETSYRELMDRKVSALVAQRDAARAAEKTRQTAPARERARERADAAQAQIAPLRAAIRRQR